MNLNLQRLIDLQAVDVQLDHLRRANVTIPEEIEQFTNRAAEERQRLEQAETGFEALQSAVRQFEREDEEDAERLGKAHGRLLSCKTNEEYRATLSEIDYIKAHRSETETKILEHLDQLDETQPIVEQLRGEVEEHIKALERDVNSRQSEFNGLEGSLSDAEARRQKIAAEVESPWIKAYQKVRENRPGDVVVRVEKESCLGCHMSLPPQFVQEVRHNSRLTNCPHCLRILYFVEPASADDAARS